MGVLFIKVNSLQFLKLDCLFKNLNIRNFSYKLHTFVITEIIEEDVDAIAVVTIVDAVVVLVVVVVVLVVVVVVVKAIVDVALLTFVQQKKIIKVNLFLYNLGILMLWIMAESS